MKFHVAAYSASQAAAALTALAPINDIVMTLTNTNYLLPLAGFARIGGIYGQGANLSRVQLQAPSLVSIGYPEVAPVDKSATISSPSPFYDLFDSPLEVQPTEQIGINELQTSGIAERETVVVFFVSGPADPVKGPIYTLRFTNTDTLTAFTWQNGVLTSAAGLRAGKYDVVGLRYQGAGAIAARIVFKDPAAGIARPGCLGSLAVSTLSVQSFPRFRMGATGIWGTFDNMTVPSIDFLSSSADTSQTILMDVMYRPN